MRSIISSLKFQAPLIISKIFKTHPLFFLLIPIVLISQMYLLSYDSKLGLIDVDNGTLYYFRQLRDKYPDNLQFLINSYKNWGTYSHQFYYMGLLNYFFGTNFENYHIVAHIFKITATIGIYPLFYFLSGSSLVAFLGAISYSTLPSSMGSLYGISNGNDYPAILTLTIFLIFYLYSIKKNVVSLKWLLYMFVFFFSSLVISPERSLPIIVLILIFEAIWILGHYSNASLITSTKRAGILLSPILLFLILKPSSDAVGSMITLQANIGNLLKGIAGGRWDYLMNPFISFSSTFLPSEHWTFIGVTQTDNLIQYMINLLIAPMLTLFIPTLIVIAVLSKKPLRFILLVFLITMFGGISSYFWALGHQGMLINQSIAGFYILGLAAGFLMEYLENKNLLYFGLFFGPFVSFIIIITMWLTSGKMDPFQGVFRYLTIASVFSCLGVASFIVLLHKRIYQKRMLLMLISLLPFLLLIQIIRLNILDIKDYYDYSLATGNGWEDQNKMRQLLFPYYQNLSIENPRLIYIDIHTDSINTQYYSNTIYAGGHAWPMYWPNVGTKEGIVPQLVIDYQMLKSWVTKKDEKVGLFDKGISQSYKPTLYKPENFFAVRLINRKLIDITDQVKKDLGLYE